MWILGSKLVCGKVSKEFIWGLWVPRNGFWRMCQNRFGSIWDCRDKFGLLKSEPEIGLGSNLDLRVKISILKSDLRIRFGIMAPENWLMKDVSKSAWVHVGLHGQVWRFEK